jgi:hypothetical protein
MPTRSGCCMRNTVVVFALCLQAVRRSRRGGGIDPGCFRGCGSGWNIPREAPSSTWLHRLAVNEVLGRNEALPVGSQVLSLISPSCLNDPAPTQGNPDTGPRQCDRAAAGGRPCRVRHTTSRAIGMRKSPR